MTEPVSAIVACPVCSGWGLGEMRELSDDPPMMTCICKHCNGTGLIRIRALAEDVPTIDRVPSEPGDFEVSTE